MTKYSILTQWIQNSLLGTLCTSLGVASCNKVLAGINKLDVYLSGRKIHVNFDLILINKSVPSNI